MTAQIRPVTSAPSANARYAAEEQERRKTRLMGVLSQGLPTLPSYVLDLNVLLGQSVVDLKKIGNVIRTDPSLTAQVLRLCNSALFGLRHRVINIEQAAILLGTERLRTLVLTCSVMQFAGKRLPKEQLSIFWHHSFLCALLSERLATQLHYCEKEQAYLGGLLHDIGQLPMWILVLAEEGNRRPPPPKGWVDNLALERDYFGMDHCKVGRWMGVSWNYMPSFIDVFEFHHAPEKAQHDPYLVGIVAVADQFLMAQASSAESSPLEAHSFEALPAESRANHAHAIGVAPPAPHSLGTHLSGHSAAEFRELEGSNSSPSTPQVVLPFLEKCLPELVESERHAVMEMLQTEYLHLLPLVQLGMTVAAADGA
jgi:HD-like signal output (HDOD) protein